MDSGALYRYQLQSLLDISHKIESFESEDDLINELFHTLMGTIGCDKAIWFSNFGANFKSIVSKGISFPHVSFEMDKKELRQAKKIADHFFSVDAFNSYKLPKFGNTISSFCEEHHFYFVIPLIYRQNFVGLIFIGKPALAKEYKAEQIQFIDLYVAFVTSSIYMLQSHIKLEKQNFDLKLNNLNLQRLNDVSIRVSASLEHEQIFKEYFNQSLVILNSSQATLFNEKEIIKSSSDDENLKSCLNRAKKVDLLEMSSDKKEIIAVLKGKSEVHGYLIMTHKEDAQGRDLYTDDDLRLLKAITLQTALILDHSKLFEEVNRMKRLMENILQSLNSAVISTDVKGEINLINRTVSDLFQNKNAKIGNAVFSVFDKDENIKSTIDTTLKMRLGNVLTDIPCLSLSEEARINLSSTPLLTPDRKVIGSVQVIDDLTSEYFMKSALNRYVSPNVVNELLTNKSKVNLGGESKFVTMLFSDIRGFTSMSERMEPADIVESLNEYFDIMLDIIFENGGTIDKLVGDEIMATFGAPITHDDDAIRAVKTAIEMNEALLSFNKAREKAKKIPMTAGIGLNSGQVISGNIGSSKYMDYTVIGDTVNAAARLCSHASAMEIVISESTYKLVKDHYKIEALDDVFVKGKQEKLKIYRVI